MAQEIALKIPQIGDRGVNTKFNEILTKFGADSMQATAATVADIVLFPKDGYDNTPAVWTTILKLNSSLVQTLHLRAKALTIAYHRRGRDKNSAVYDELIIHFNVSVPMDVAERLEIIAFVEKAFKSFDPERAIASAPDVSTLAAFHESTLTRLEEVATKVVEETAASYALHEQQFLQKRECLEEEYANLKAELDADHEARISNFHAKEADLIARQESVDDRDNTHARRATRNAMLEDVKARILNFGVSEKTSAKRRNVTRGFVMLFVLLTLMLAWSMTEVSQAHQLRSATIDAKVSSSAATAGAVWDKTELYVVWARISVLTIGLLFSILYYIKWENRWAEQHATAEFQLQQFYIDVNRGNWVVESGLEWHKETGSTIPDTIMQSLTNNLFRFSDEAPAALHPADELASALLGSASKLKLKAGNSELEFDKPNKIKEKI